MRRTTISATVLNLGILGAAICVGAAPRYRGEEIDAKSLTLRDENGTPRAVLALTKEGDPLLSLYDSQGKSRLEVGLEQGQASSIVMFDEKGEAQVSVHAGEDGGSAIGFEGKDGSNLLLKLDPGKSIGLVVHGREAKGGMECTYNYNLDSYGFSMSDSNDKARIMFDSGISGRPGVVLLDGNGNPRLDLTMTDDGDPLFRMWNQDGGILTKLPPGSQTDNDK